MTPHFRGWLRKFAAMTLSGIVVGVASSPAHGSPVDPTSTPTEPPEASRPSAMAAVSPTTRLSELAASADPATAEAAKQALAATARTLAHGLRGERAAAVLADTAARRWTFVAELRAALYSMHSAPTCAGPTPKAKAALTDAPVKPSDAAPEGTP